jgi:hypothetical protein
MDLKRQLYNLGAKFILERPARARGLKDYEEIFVHTGKKLADKYATADDTNNTRRVISHVIGIERWGQRRLKVAFGDAFNADEYNNYRPPREASLESLQFEFNDTRAETIDIIRRMQEQAVDLDVKIEHNQYGPLTIRAWLQYLHTHSKLKSDRLEN